jgi:segregation and condensation protein A
VGEEFFYEVELEEVRVEEKIDLVLAELREKGRVLFVDLVTRRRHRLHVVVAFMAILELARMGRVVLAQEATFGQIWIYPVKDGRVIRRAGAEEESPQATDGQRASPATESPEASDGSP